MVGIVLGMHTEEDKQRRIDSCLSGVIIRYSSKFTQKLKNWKILRIKIID